MQVIGQTLVANGDEQPQYYYTPWFPRIADNAVFTYERIHSSLTTPEVVTVYHKDAEDAGSEGALVSTTWTQLGSTSLYEAKCSDLREMVRFKVELASSAVEVLHFRFLPPTWYTKAV
jgi:hypothetical protein